MTNRLEIVSFNKDILLKLAIFLNKPSAFDYRQLGFFDTIKVKS